MIDWIIVLINWCKNITKKISNYIQNTKKQEGSSNFHKNPLVINND